MTDIDRDRSVRADMERAFGLPGGPIRLAAPADTEHAPPTSVATAATPEPRRRWLLLAAPILVALFVVAVAVRFALGLVPGNTTAPATPGTPPAAYSATAPARPGLPVEPEATPTLPPDDFGPAPVDAAPLRPSAQAPALPRAPAAVTDRAILSERTDAEDCPPGAREDRCIYRDVVGADRRLRAAYDTATRSGVPRDELVAVRRRWDRARAISLDAPDETIRRYEELADRLDVLARNGGR